MYKVKGRKHGVKEMTTLLFILAGITLVSAGAVSYEAIRRERKQEEDRKLVRCFLKATDDK